MPRFFRMDEPALGLLIETLRHKGYTVVGPHVRDGAVAYDEIAGGAELPYGWSGEQDAGRYRLKKDPSAGPFDYVIGPGSWKQWLHPPEAHLFSAERDHGSFRILPNTKPSPRYALLGVRACELAAIAIQDRVLLGDRFADPIYQARRNALFVVAVSCTRSASTCFCASMHTGPRATDGFDVALTPVGNGRGFVVETGTDAGDALAAELGWPEPAPEMLTEAVETVRAAATSQTRAVELEGLAEALSAAAEHPHWEQVAKRCLACGNCTMSCPTCFCTTVEDASTVDGARADRWRRWDSCFTQSFSYIHGGSVRSSVKSRYRQWLTHKLAHWQRQFGTPGCVGCGRCITWCPAGIDITEEARALRA
jgi:sulfhydrogenase subunit beta (sulfur reductase)